MVHARDLEDCSAPLTPLARTLHDEVLATAARTTPVRRGGASRVGARVRDARTDGRRRDGRPPPRTMAALAMRGPNGQTMIVSVGTREGDAGEGTRSGRGDEEDDGDEEHDDDECSDSGSDGDELSEVDEEDSEEREDEAEQNITHNRSESPVVGHSEPSHVHPPTTPIEVVYIADGPIDRSIFFRYRRVKLWHVYKPVPVLQVLSLSGCLRTHRRVRSGWTVEENADNDFRRLRLSNSATGATLTYHDCTFDEYKCDNGLHANAFVLRNGNLEPLQV